MRNATHALQKGVALPLMPTKMGSLKWHQNIFIYTQHIFSHFNSVHRCNVNIQYESVTSAYFNNQRSFKRLRFTCMLR